MTNTTKSEIVLKNVKKSEIPTAWLKDNDKKDVITFTVLLTPNTKESQSKKFSNASLVTDMSSMVNNEYLEVLKHTQGVWAEDNWETTKRKRRDIELSASQKRKTAW